MKKIFIKLPVIIFLLFGNLALSETLEENFQKQREEMINIILKHSSILGNNNIEISRNLIDALKNDSTNKYIL